MLYNYKTTIVKGSNADQTDFENNFKSQALEVDSIIFAETTGEIIKTYDEFKAKIVSPILWSDVKYTENTNQYELNLLSEIPL